MKTRTGTGMGLLLSAAVTGAVLGFVAFLLSGCAAESGVHPVRALRLAIKARPLDCRDARGVPVPCPGGRDWP